MTEWKECGCGGSISPARWALGYRICLECGDWVARQKVWTVTHGHKSSFFVVTDRETLKQLNPKRTT